MVASLPETGCLEMLGRTTTVLLLITTTLYLVRIPRKSGSPWTVRPTIQELREGEAPSFHNQVPYYGEADPAEPHRITDTPYALSHRVVFLQLA